MKVVFLDFDGVLNSEEWYWKGGTLAVVPTFDPACVERLRRILDATGAAVVLTTAWRVNGVERCIGWLAEAGLECRVIGRTPRLRGDRRDEIRAWLVRHGATVERFVVLDDSEDADIGGGRFVRTDWRRGLQDDHVERAVAVLAGGGRWAGRGGDDGRAEG